MINFYQRAFLLFWILKTYNTNISVANEKKFKSKTNVDSSPLDHISGHLSWNCYVWLVPSIKRKSNIDIVIKTPGHSWYGDSARVRKGLLLHGAAARQTRADGPPLKLSFIFLSSIQFREFQVAALLFCCLRAHWASTVTNGVHFIKQILAWIEGFIIHFCSRSLLAVS